MNRDPQTSTPRRTSLRGQDGWSLVEVIVGMVMMLIITLAAFPIVDGAANTEGRIQDAALSVGDARNFTEQVLHDLRPATKLVTASASTLTVDTYVHRANCTGGAYSSTPTECAVTYSCTGLARSVSCTRRESQCVAPFASGPPVTAINGISNANVFSYQTLGNGDNPDFVNVKLAIPNTRDSTSDLITLQDGTALRNLLLSGSC